MTARSTGARAAAKLATRTALIDAAVAEFVEHGPAGASLDAICARAGKTRGAFYVHFPDREALMIAVMDRLLGGLLRSITSTGRPGDAGLAGGIRTFAAAAAARAPAVHAGREFRFHHVLEACRTSTAIGDRYRMIVDAAASWAKQAVAAEQRAGRLRRVDARDAGYVVVAIAFGLVVLLELGMRVDGIRLGETLVGMLDLGGVAPRRRRAARHRPTRPR